jgi:hypothetical protein
MLATFCARLALGLIAGLALLSPYRRQLHPRFYRTHFLTALGLLVVATFAAWGDVGPWTRVLLASATGTSLLGAISWTLEPAPAGRTLLLVPWALLIAALASVSNSFLAFADQFSSALFLGIGLTAMLVGHSYLISPGMTLTPLMCCFRGGAVALVLRVAVIGEGLWRWTDLHPTYNLNNEVVLWLPVRWLVGILAPLGFGWMAFSAARIRSTQSATGILYVVVVCGFLGELLGLLLTRQTGLPL